jgi:hypothetical protein
MSRSVDVAVRRLRFANAQDERISAASSFAGSVVRLGMVLQVAKIEESATRRNHPPAFVI